MLKGGGIPGRGLTLLGLEVLGMGARWGAENRNKGAGQGV